MATADIHQSNTPTPWPAIRKNAGLTIAAAAQHFDVSVATIRRFESEASTMGDTLRSRLSIGYRRLAAEVAALPNPRA